MSPATIAAIAAVVAATGSLLTGLAVVITSFRTDRKVDVRADELAERTDEQAHETGGKLEEIHELVNSRLTAALSKIERLEKELGIEPTDN